MYHDTEEALNFLFFDSSKYDPGSRTTIAFSETFN